MEIVYLLHGKTIGTAVGANRAECQQAFVPTLREMVLKGKVKRSDLNRIMAEERNPIDVGAIIRADSARTGHYAPVGNLHTLGGDVLPVKANAQPIRSENGRLSHGVTEWREWYRVGKSTVVVTRDRTLNDEIIEWRYDG